MNIELLQQLCEASAVSGDEQEVRDILINTLEPCVNEITFDGLGSFVARKGNKGPKVAVVGHMDEVGFMVTHIDESGFLRFTTIGGWWNQSILNHRVTIRTHKGFKIPGVIGSVAPHALTEKQKQQPLSFDEMFIDIGANSREEAEKRGVEIGNFISPEANFACWGEDKVVGKALDNRIGCAMMAELLQTVNNPEITLYGVGSVEEEVGLRGAQTSAEHIKPDVVIVLDTAVAGDVPGIDNIKYPLKLGQGPGLMLFDKRYFPNQKLVVALKSCATHNDLPLQFSTWIKCGSRQPDKLVMGMGHMTRANSEDCLFAVKGKLPPRINAGIVQSFTAPRLEHSRKPDVVREKLVQLLGDVSRIELFARQSSHGFDVWGNQCEDSAVQLHPGYALDIGGLTNAFSNSPLSPTDNQGRERAA
nr:aminopeptidase [Escherichia coli]